MILLDGGISKTGMVKVDFFAYSSFRKRFMKVLLDLLEKDIGKEKFKDIKNKLYLDKTNNAQDPCISNMSQLIPSNLQLFTHLTSHFS